MADYARPGGQARFLRNQAEQVRRIRTRRPLRGGVKALSYPIEGQITLDRYFPPFLVTIDPVSEGDYPEHKQIVALDAWLSVGGCTISWLHNSGYVYENQEIGESVVNRVVLPEPFLIENGATYGGEFFQLELQEEPTFPTFHLTCILIVEAVPV